MNRRQRGSRKEKRKNYSVRIPAQVEWTAYRRLFDLAANSPARPALRNSLGASLGAAAIDGATFTETLLFVTLPLARAGVATAALFALLLAWDEFFFALLFTSSARAKTLTVTIAGFAAGRATDFGLVAAAGLLTSLPRSRSPSCCRRR